MGFNSYLHLIFESGINWIDILTIVVIIAYAIEGYAIGFLNSLYDLLSFTLSFFAGLVFYGPIAALILSLVKIPQGFANVIGFFAIAFIFEVVLSILFKTIAANYHSNTTDNEFKKPIISKLSGSIFSVMSGLIVISFVLTIITTLPLSMLLKQAVSSSALGNVLVANTQGLSKSINAVFGKAINDNLSFLTVEPQGSQVLSLNFKTDQIAADSAAENSMLDLVNFERKKIKLSELEFSYELQQVARFHCEDMLRNGYFSHYSQNGDSPFDRMARFDIYYSVAGENLAFAPNVSLAMKGLMQSKGHRENILSKDFRKVGIGIIDAGIYGQMYCQEFTD